MNSSSQVTLTTLYRLTRLVMHLIYGVTVAIIYPNLSRNLQLNIQKSWSRKLLAIFNIPLNVRGEQFISCPDGCLQIANHVSWLDIFVLNAIQPSHFIAKSEVQDWPVIGWLCKRAGTLFLERASRQGASAMNQKIVEKLNHGERVGLFPEGTTTDGARINSFRPALMQPAIDADAAVSPISIRYHDTRGNLSSNAPFTGDTTLVESIWNMLSGRQIIATVTYAPPINTSGENRRTLSDRVRAVITNNLGSKVASANADAVNEAEESLPRGLLASPAFVLLFDATLYQLPD